MNRMNMYSDDLLLGCIKPVSFIAADKTGSIFFEHEDIHNSRKFSSQVSYNIWKFTVEKTGSILSEHDGTQFSQILHHK